MLKRFFLAAIVLALLLALVPLAMAITFGEPDGDAHPNVGAMIIHEPDGVDYLYCTGTLIAPDVFLTAAHCTAAADFY
ncbi:MAG: trypsin-like serine protease, partial [Chloroflexota bacterium]